MRVFIIGAGALGLLIGGMFRAGAADVTFMTRTVTQTNTLQRHGVTVVDQNRAHTYPVQALPFQAKSNGCTLKTGPSGTDISTYDIIIVTVKQYHLDALLPWIAANIPTKIPLLFIMNGLGHQEKIAAQLRHRSILLGMTEMGATKRDAHVVEVHGKGFTKIGPLRSISASSTSTCPERETEHSFETFTHPNTSLPACVRSLEKIWNQYNMNVVWSDTIDIELWRKWIINACMNPLTALFRVRNGALLEDKLLHTKMHTLYEEAKHVVKLARPTDRALIIDKPNLWNQIQNVCRQTSSNQSSMLQDIQHGRQTEIDGITGYLLEKASVHDVQTPYHQFVYDAIRIIERKK